MTDAPAPVLPPVAAPRPAWLVPTMTGAGGLIVGLAIGLLAPVAVASALGSGEVTVFADALDACDMSSSSNVAIGDEGTSLTIDSKGDEDIAGITYDQLTCLMTALDTPQAVVAHVGQTTSMDGRQTETWDGITMSWSYHPDRGLDAVYTYSPEH